jgi:sulfoxide reductase heme-binding subunit YedZ
MIPWYDRTGRPSWLKLAVLLLLLAPGAWLAMRWRLYGLGARPFTEAILVTGIWAVRFLWLSLAITPLRRLANWPQLIIVRRMVGVGALGYVLAHLVLYAIEQGTLWRVVTEIAQRTYLQIGFVAILVLVALGVTSTDGWVRRLGGKAWQRLHRAAYIAAFLGGVHFLMQAKAGLDQATLMMGLLIWLLAYRLVIARQGPVPMGRLAMLAMLASALAAIWEAGWYAVMKNLDGTRLLAANLDPELGPRPAAWVLAAGLAMIMVAHVRRPRPPARVVAPASSD